MKSPARLFSLLVIASLLAALAAVPPTQPVHAASIVVNAAGDLANAGNGFCTLREAITNANNDSDSSGGDCAAGSGADTISFAGNLTITLSAQLPTVTTQITIQGNGALNTIIQGDVAPYTSPGHGVFEVRLGGELTLQDLTVRNAFCDNTGPFCTMGAAINSGSTDSVTIIRSIFSENALGGNASTEGGAIFSNGKLTIIDSFFFANTAGYNNPIPYYAAGGAIYSTDDTTITHSVFSNNSATLEGGAIRAANIGTVAITDSEFSSNSARQGGALYIYGGSAPVITDTHFAENDASDDGGAVWVHDVSALTLDGSTFVANHASGRGGAISSGGVTTISDSSFSGNSADVGGGALHNQIGGDMSITNSSLTENSSDRGGAIRNWADLSMVDSELLDNSAVSEGGGIYNTGDLSLLRSELEQNLAAFGGGLYNDGGDVAIDRSRIQYNSVSAWGGGLHNAEGTLTITEGTIASNYADYGGGIVNSDNLTIQDSTIAYNVALSNGGGIANFSADLTASNVTLVGNGALIGGALYNDFGTATFLNSTFAENGAYDFGGGIFNEGQTTALFNTIVANSPTGGDCINVGGILTADAYNFDTDGSCANATQKTSAELNLDALADNGGPSETLGLLPGSHAIDAGNGLVCSAAPVSNLDQRGQSRTEDGNADGGADCDVGAYELQSTTLTFTSDLPDPSQVNAAFTVDVTVTAANGTPTGSVNVSDGTDSCIIALSSGTGNCAFTSTTSGLKTLSAAYVGAPNFAPSVETQGHAVYSLISTFQSRGASDGSVLESSETSGVGGTTNSAANTVRVGDDNNDAQYRGILHFDTGSLPDTSVIVHADLQVKRQSVTGADLPALSPLRADIRSPQYGANAALQPQDFQATTDMFSAAVFAPPPAAGWFTAALDAAAHLHVNLTGSTQFRLRFALDDNDDLSADYVEVFSGDAAAANRPLLVVYYYTVP